MRFATVGCVLMCLMVSISRAADDAASLGKLLVKPDAHQPLVNPDCSHCVDEARRKANMVKAGIGIGIGSAAIVAALLYSNSARRKKGDTKVAKED